MTGCPTLASIETPFCGGHRLKTRPGEAVKDLPAYGPPVKVPVSAPTSTVDVPSRLEATVGLNVTLYAFTDAPCIRGPTPKDAPSSDWPISVTTPRDA